jgi:hypothetical protein
MKLANQGIRSDDEVLVEPHRRLRARGLRFTRLPGNRRREVLLVGGSTQYSLDSKEELKEFFNKRQTAQ